MSEIMSETTEIFFAGYTFEELAAETGELDAGGQARLRRCTELTMRIAGVEPGGKVMIVRNPDLIAAEMTDAVLDGLPSDVHTEIIISPWLADGGDHPGTQTIGYMTGGSNAKKDLDLRDTTVFFVVEEPLVRHYTGDTFHFLFAEHTNNEPLVIYEPKINEAPGFSPDALITTAQQLNPYRGADVPIMPKEDSQPTAEEIKVVDINKYRRQGSKVA